MIEQGTRTLIVDDDPFVCEMLAMILEGAGFATEMAATGEDAYRKVSGGAAFGLIVTDMNMPGMGGIELVRKLRADGIDTPVIMLTGNSEVSSAMEAIRSGADDYLVKDENIQDTVIFWAGRVLEHHSMKLRNIQLEEELQDLKAAMERDRA